MSILGELHDVAAGRTVPLCGPLARPSSGPGPVGCASRQWHPPRTTDVTTAAAGRRWARSVLSDLLLQAPAPDLVAVVELLITELISNAVTHGGGMCEASITRWSGRVRVTVCDADPRPPVVTQAVTGEDEHGRGMWLVTALAERWGVRQRGLAGKCVWADVRTAAAPGS